MTVKNRNLIVLKREFSGLLHCPWNAEGSSTFFMHQHNFFIGIEDPLTGTKGTKKGNEFKLHETTELLFENS